eukprot:357287-Alexandrium_andersonii.AAC.1
MCIRDSFPTMSASALRGLLAAFSGEKARQARDGRSGTRTRPRLRRSGHPVTTPTSLAATRIASALAAASACRMRRVSKTYFRCSSGGQEGDSRESQGASGSA